MASTNRTDAEKNSAAKDGKRKNAFYAGEKSFGRLVFFLSRNYQAYLDKVVAPYGISSAHVPLLAYLWAGEPGDTQNDIARYLAVDKGTVSRNVAALVRLGLVTQTSSMRDSRACIIALTEKGWDLAEPIAALSAAWSDAVAVDLGDTESKQTRDTLEKMCERAEELVADLHGPTPAPSPQTSAASPAAAPRIAEASA